MVGAEIFDRLILDRLSNGNRWPSGRLPSRLPFGRIPTRSGLWAGAGLLAASVAVLMLERWLHAGGGRAVKDVMVEDVLTIDASASIAEAAQRMRDGNVGVLPVVEDGRLRGIVTDRDLVVRALAVAADPSTTRVGDCATWDTVCARADSPIDEVMEVMAECQIGRLPVVDPDNRVIGIVTLSSLALRSRERGEALQTAQEVSRRSARSVA
jgi:CBS domain-containing protein